MSLITDSHLSELCLDKQTYTERKLVKIYNHIEYIPDCISSLVNLQGLYLSNNHIDNLSIASSLSIEYTDFSNQTPKSDQILYLPPIIV